MATLLFVHGTGVRKDSFEQTLACIRTQAAQHLPALQVAACLWGDAEGSQFHGVSLPVSVEEGDIAQWRMLLRDPFSELRIIAQMPKSDAFRPHGESIWQQLTQQTPGPRTTELLTAYGWNGFWPRCYGETLNWESVIRESTDADGTIESALARCLLAQLMNAASESLHPPIDGESRDLLESSLIQDLGGAARALAGWIGKLGAALFAAAPTPVQRWSRDIWSSAISPAMGDILLYQARGAGIRSCIRDTIQKLADDEVIVLAHSLGGIACVDLLLLENIDRVKALITVGSQSPYLYEINALVGLERGGVWPAHFRQRWLNIYDPNDFLSYPGERILGKGRVQDFESHSRQPFPESHSAYWRRNEVWEAIRCFLQ